MNLNRNLMLDIETLAVDRDAVVLTIAGIRFNHMTDYSAVTDPRELDYFYCRVDPDSQAERVIHDDTLKWWASQPENVRNEAFDPTDRFSLEDAMTAFNYWASGADNYWANGITFDYPILDSCNRAVGQQSVWKFWQVMDTRTIYKMVPDHIVPKNNHHHALYDCMTQIVRLNDCLRRLKVSVIK